MFARSEKHLNGHYVYIASCIIYSGVGVIWQPFYSMCDMMYCC